MNKKDLKIETLKGKGKGGQRKNKVETAVRITHIPTGITAYVDGREQAKNKKLALKEIEQRLKKRKEEKKALVKKKIRDKKIKEHNIIRTYMFHKGLVKDHRTGKTATIKNIIQKGKLDLLK